jgi:bacillithiol biosynthesis deacetylase BshB1
VSEAIDCLALGAHPDDVEVGAGGVLVKLRQLGYRTGLAVLTRGELGTGGTPEVREREIDRAAAIMGAEVLAKLDWGDTRLVDTPERREQVAILYRRYRPRLVLAPYYQGGHGQRASHPDHLAAGKLAINAVPYAALAKLDIPGEPYQVPALFHYFLPPEVMPTFVVDITAQFDAWMESLKAHASQFQNPDKPRDYLRFLETRARHYGSLVGVNYGQGFVAGEPMSIHDPMMLVPS